MTTPVSATPGFVRTDDGVDLFVRDWGEGPLLVFVASWSLPSDSWGYQMLASTRAGFRAVAYDRRGHGRSSDPGRGWDFDTLADDLDAIMRARDLAGAVLVGHSMATGEIVRYLARHGAGRVAGIVLVGTITPGLVRRATHPQGIDPAAFEAFRSQELGRDLSAWIEANMEPFLTPQIPRGMRDWITGMVLGASLLALHDCNVAIGEADFSTDLARVAVPTLIVHGGRDVTCPPALTAQATARSLPHARLAMYDDAPHGLFLTHMERFNGDLLGFAKGL